MMWFVEVGGLWHPGEPWREIGFHLRRYSLSLRGDVGSEGMDFNCPRVDLNEVAKGSFREMVPGHLVRIGAALKASNPVDSNNQRRPNRRGFQ